MHQGLCLDPPHPSPVLLELTDPSFCLARVWGSRSVSFLALLLEAFTLQIEPVKRGLSHLCFLISLTTQRQQMGGQETGHEICLPISTLSRSNVTSHHWQLFLGKQET